MEQTDRQSHNNNPRGKGGGRANVRHDNVRESNAHLPSIGHPPLVAPIDVQCHTGCHTTKYTYQALAQTKDFPEYGSLRRTQVRVRQIRCLPRDDTGSSQSSWTLRNYAVVSSSKSMKDLLDKTKIKYNAMRNEGTTIAQSPEKLCSSGTWITGRILK